MTAPFFTVVIPLYNKREYIESTMASVLGQSFTDFEVVVVDDGSVDDGADRVEALGDPRIRLIRQGNAGVSAARNRAIEAARGRYLAFLDADDRWHRDHLQHAFAFFTLHPEVRWYCSGWQRGRHAAAPGCDSAAAPRFGVESYLDQGYRRVWTSAVVVEAALVQSLGGFSPRFSRGEDLHLWYRIARLAPSIGGNGSVTASYLDAGSSLTKLTDSTMVRSWDFVLDFLEPQAEGQRLDPALRSFVKKRIYAFLKDGQSGQLLEFLNRYPAALSPWRRSLYRSIALLPLGGEQRIVAFRILNKLGLI